MSTVSQDTVALTEAADKWEIAMLALRDRVSARGIPHKYAARVFFELTMTPNPYASADPTPEPTP